VQSEVDHFLHRGSRFTPPDGIGFAMTGARVV
jgi:hypothetical protein